MCESVIFSDEFARQCVAESPLRDPEDLCAKAGQTRQSMLFADAYIRVEIVEPHLFHSGRDKSLVGSLTRMFVMHTYMAKNATTDKSLA